MYVVASSLRAEFVLIAALSVAGCLGATERAPDEVTSWQRGMPVLGDLDGDGIEELVTNSWEGMVALSGVDYRPLWHRADRKVEFHAERRLAVVAGGAVVMAQARTLEVLDAKSGATRASVVLTDKVESLCADGGKVGVHQIDRVSWTLDVASGQRDDATPPAKCHEMVPRPTLCRTAWNARCEGDNVKLTARLTDAVTGDSVRVDIKEPGTPEVTIVGLDGAGQPTYSLPFDPNGRRVEALDLVGGTVVIRQGQTTAIDARTGAVLWKSSCGGSSGEFSVGTASRVYYECDGPKSAVALRIVDRATGNSIRDIGNPR